MASPTASTPTPSFFAFCPLTPCYGLGGGEARLLLCVGLLARNLLVDPWRRTSWGPPRTLSWGRDTAWRSAPGRLTDCWYRTRAVEQTQLVFWWLNLTCLMEMMNNRVVVWGPGAALRGAQPLCLPLCHPDLMPVEAGPELRTLTAVV